MSWGEFLSIEHLRRHCLRFVTQITVSRKKKQINKMKKDSQKCEDKKAVVLAFE